MATLAVRPLSPRDLPALRHVHQRSVRLDFPRSDDSLLPEVAREALSVLPAARERAFVALVDGELCALAVLRPDERQFRWDVVRLAAGSPRLDASDDVCQELWAALMEYTVRRAGEAGARRLRATAEEGGVALASLRSAGFEPYLRYTVVNGTRPEQPVELPLGMRQQHPSDVWSVHQLYHHVTPKPVQFAEALTSSAWEPPRRSFSALMQRRPSDVAGFVLATDHGIEGYCRVDVRGRGALVQLLINPGCFEQAVTFVLAATHEAGLGRSAPIRVVIPAYLGELVARFENTGFGVEAERAALVRHTTAPARVHVRLAPLPLEVGERVPRGVPTYLRGVRGAAKGTARSVQPLRHLRTERSSN